MAKGVNGQILRDRNGNAIPDELFTNDPLDSTLSEYQMKAEEMDALLTELDLKKYLPKK